MPATYYNDPSGYGSWLVPEGMSPGQARQYWQDVSGAQMGGPDSTLTTALQNYDTNAIPAGMARPQSSLTRLGVTDASTPGSIWPGPGTGRLTLRARNGQMVTLDASDYVGIDRLTRSGWLPLNTAGKPYQVVDYKGGQVFLDPDRPGDAFPLNELLGGHKTPEQQAAMPDFWASMGNQPGPNTPTPGLPPFVTPMPSGLAPGTTMGGMDYQALIKSLIAESLQQGQHGQESVQGIRDLLNEFLVSTMGNAAGRGDQQDALTRMMLDRLQPGMQQAIGMLGQAQGGLSPDQMTMLTDTLGSGGRSIMHSLNNMLTPLDETQGLPAGALAALRTNALDTTARAYDQSQDALKSQLLRSGAMGAQDTPGSLGDIVRGYGELESQRVGQQSQLLAQSQLANAEAQRQNYGLAQQTGLGALSGLNALGGTLASTYLQNAGQQLQGLGLSNQTALNAMNMGGNLIGTLGNIYSPNAYLGASQGAFGNLLGTTQQGIQSGLGGIQNASALMQALAAQQSGSSGIGPALLGAAGSVLGGWLTNRGRGGGGGGGITINVPGSTGNP
jgi:hypothetical protein